jgi:hypothetical protein
VVKAMYEIRKPVFILLDTIFQTTESNKYWWWEGGYNYYTVYDKRRSENPQKSDLVHGIPVKFKIQKMLQIEITTPYSSVTGVVIDLRHNTLPRT